MKLEARQKINSKWSSALLLLQIYTSYQHTLQKLMRRSEENIDLSTHLRRNGRNDLYVTYYWHRRGGEIRTVSYVLIGMKGIVKLHMQNRVWHGNGGPLSITEKRHLRIHEA